MASLPRRRYAGDVAAASPATTNVITDPFAFSAAQNQGHQEDHLHDQNDDPSSPSSSSSSSDSSSSSSPVSSPSPFHEPQPASPFFSQPSHEPSGGFHNPYAPPQAPVFQGGYEGHQQAPPPSSSSPFFGASSDDQPGAAVVHNYVSGSFQYNWRLIAMFLPCLFVLLSFGGQLLVNTLFGFAICWLITEFMNHKPMQIMLYWVGIYAFEVELMIIGAPLIYQNWVNFFVVSLFGMFIAILASWLTIQSQWLSVKMPAVTSILERLVMAVSLPVCATILTWATIAITGVTYAPYYLLMYLCVGFWCFSLPLPSSFRKTTSSRQLYILGRVELCIHSLILIVYPSAVNVAIYYKSILTLNGIVDILTLSSFAILFIRAFKPQGSLKWIGLKGKAMDTYEVLITFLGVILFLGCFEYRVVFRSFHYLIHLSAPLSYILVTVGLFGLAFLFVGIAADYLKSVGKVGSIAVASVTGLSFAAVLGLPFLLYPVIAGCAVLVIILYFDRDEKMYVGAIVCGVVSVGWFMQKQFWFLDVEIGWISLKGLTVVLLALFTIMMALPGLTFKASRNDLARLALNSILPLYAVGISITENLLFVNSPEIYPFYLIVFSSAVGLFLLRVIRLRVAGFSPISIWISQAVFVSKLALLAFPKYTALAIPYSCLYVLTMTAPPLNGKHMQRQQAYVHVLGAAISSFLIRDIIATNFLFVFFNRLPTPFLSFSVFMVLWGLACLPLSMYYFRIYNLPKQLNFLVLMVGAGTLALQLELSVIKQLVPPQVLYSYASWLLLVFFISLLVMLFFQTTFWKVVFAAVGGPALVIAITKSYFIFDLPAPWIIALLSIKVALVLFFFVFFAKPSPSSSKLLPIAFTFQFLLFPVLYLLANYGFNHILGSFRKDNIHNFKYIVIALEAFGEIVLALVMKFFLQQWIPSADSPAKPLKIDADRMEIPTSSIKSGSMQRETSWIGYAANVATVTGMVVSMYWNISFLDGSEMCVLVLAPLLLLLQKDRWIFKELDVSRRYFPLVVSVSASLVVIALLQLWLPQALSRTGSANVYALAYGLRWTISLKLKETLFLALTLPSHFYFAQWMSNYAPQSNLKWLVISPLAFLALFASLSSIKILAILALVASLSRYILSRRFQSIGNRGV